jgi:hypothetical protein
MNFDKNYGIKPLVKPLIKPFRNYRGSYDFRIREHMEDVTETETGTETEPNVEVESESNNINDDPDSVEIPPELQAPEHKQRNVNDQEIEQETGDFFDYLKESSTSAVEKMKRFLGV